MTPVKLPDPPEMVSVFVNGEEMQLPKGKNLLQALLDVGHLIPHYCYHPSLSVAGNCRLCLIEIEGRPKPEISCNMVVSDGLKILTNSELVEDCRKGMMEFLLVNHPLDCPICDRGGECMLQRYSMDYGWGHARTVEERRRFFKPQFDPLIDIERNRCIMCTRCVRFMDEVGGDAVLGVFGHGNRNYIGTYGNGPVSNVFSGNIIDICPVGCLTSKPFRFKARPWELRQTNTTLRHTNGPVTAWSRDGILYRVTPPTRKRKGLWTIDEDTTQFISNEARFGSYYANHEDRLLKPRLKQNGVFTDASWPEALGAIGEALKGCQPGQSAFLAGERSSNEEFYLLSRLARGVCRTPFIDWRMRFVDEAAAQAAGQALAASDGDLDFLEKKVYQATVMIGSDLLGTAPDIALRLKEAARKDQTRLGMIDMRLDEWFARHASALALEQPEALAATLEKLAEGLKADKAPEGYENLFNLLKAEQGLLVLGLDYAGGAFNPALVPAALKLLQAINNRWHFLPVTSARNAKGAFGCGGQSDRLATGPLADESARRASATLWGMEVGVVEPGPAAPEILERAARGEFKVLFLNRADELVTHPRRELVEKAILKTPFVAVVDIFPSWITEKADVVLPGSLFYESDGSMTDIDGTLQRMTQGVRPAGDAQEEWRILATLIEMMGAKINLRRSDQIFAELVQAWGVPRPFRLDDLLLPGPGKTNPQEHHQFFGQRSRPNFKLSFSRRPEIQPRPLELPAAQGEQHRLLWSHNCQGEDHLGSRSTEFDALRVRPKIELNAADAERLGLAEGDWVLLQGGSADPSQVVVNRLLAEGVAYGAANVLGLKLPESGPALPLIQLKKTQAPAGAQAPTEAELVS